MMSHVALPSSPGMPFCSLPNKRVFGSQGLEAAAATESGSSGEGEQKSVDLCITRFQEPVALEF